MKKTTKNAGIKVNTGVKAGNIWVGNHSQTGLRVKTGLKAGISISRQNHNRRLAKV